MHGLFPDTELQTGAIFSPCRTYRYILWRVWDISRPLVLFIALNPSTADERKNDPTIRREIDFATRWGGGGLIKGNLFGFRSKDPSALARVIDPVGPENDKTIREFAADCLIKVAAWGADKAVTEARVEAMLGILGECHCLGVTKDGHPKHPLYLAKKTPLVPFKWTRAA